MRPRKFTHEDIAVAYELFCEGVCWKLIERYLGDGIRFSVNNAIRNGLHDTHNVYD